MKNIKSIYHICYLYNTTPEQECYLADYDPMIEDFGNVLFKVDDDDYQGDSYVFYGNMHKDSRFGYLNFGWGSCSGCDALQRCSTWEEVQELYEFLHSQIKWFDSAKEAYKWFTEHDWEGDYLTKEKKWFVKIVTCILEQLTSD